MVPLPRHTVSRVRDQIETVRKWHAWDLAEGHGRVWLPWALAETFPHANRQLGWQYLFPSQQLSDDPRGGERSLRRHHGDESTDQKRRLAAREQPTSSLELSLFVLSAAVLVLVLVLDCGSPRENGLL